MKKWIKSVAVKLTLQLAVWSFNKLFAWVDDNKDGLISKQELLKKAGYLDKQTKKFVQRIKKK